MKTATLNSYRITLQSGKEIVQWVRFAETLELARESAKDAASAEGLTFLYAEPCTDPRG